MLTGHTLSSVEEGGVSLLDGDHTLFAHCQVKSELLPVRWCDFGVENRPEFLSSFIIIHTLCHLRASSVWRRKKSLEQYSQVNTSPPSVSVHSMISLSLSLSDPTAAVNDSCLVFDERLVVDRDHQTNDPAILAAGPMTKFSRSYHSNHWWESSLTHTMH